jgi:hypothetical protein
MLAFSWLSRENRICVSTAGSRWPPNNPEKTRMNCKTVGIALALSMLSFAAVAQSTTPQNSDTTASSDARAEARAKFRAACAEDVQKFCANVERAKGAMRSCLDSNAPQLSESCTTARAERAAARAARAAANNPAK